MWNLKTLNEIENILNNINQETDLSKKVKSIHELKLQFKLCMDRINQLERHNQSLKSELELDPEYQQKQLILSMNSIFKTFMKI